MAVMRCLLGLAAILALPTLLAVDLLWAALGGWPITTTVVVLLCGLLAAPCAPLVFRGYREFLSQHAGRLWLSTCSFLLAIAACAAVLAVLERRKPFHTRAPLAKFEFDPSPWALPGVSQAATMSINSQGVRGPELPANRDVYRILCIGGGTTECLYLDDAETWPALLMQQLNRRGDRATWVGSVGYSEYGVEQHARFIRNSPLVRQVDCLVLLVGASDVLNWALGFENHRPWVANVVQKVRPPGLLVDREGIELVKLRSMADFGRPRIDQQHALDRYEHLLRGTIAATKAAGVRAVFVSHPVLWDDLLPDLPRAKLRYARMVPTPRPQELLRPGKCRELMDLFNARLEVVCAQEEAEFVDGSVLSGCDQYFYDDVHLSEAGCVALSDLLSEYFESTSDRLGKAP